MKVTIDKYSGFCFGVTSAIQKAEQELQQGPLYCLGDIVHNGQEVERLAAMGLKTIHYDEFNLLHNVRVLLRAHGEPPSTYQKAIENHIQIIDASCPVVLHLQQRIRETYQKIKQTNEKAQIVIFGKVGHAEVIGLQGQTDNTALVVEQLADLSMLDYSGTIYLFSQTTKSVEEFQQIVEAIKLRTEQPNQLFVYDSICRNVAGRVQKLQLFARNNDWVIFVGGKKSSNAKVLFQHCLNANPQTIFVSSEEELTNQIIQQCRHADKVGICGATSTPLWLMQRVAQRLETTE